MSNLSEFPSLYLTDYLVNDLTRIYSIVDNKLIMRVNLYWLLEIQVKKLNSVYFPEKFNASKGSHNVMGSVYLHSKIIPELADFIYRLTKGENQLYEGRLRAIQTFDYVSARYSNALEVFRAELPLVEDLFELYWILSNHLRQLGFS